MLPSNLSIALAVSLAFAAIAPVSGQPAPAPGHGHSFTVKGDHFELDGKPFQVISGEMHYPRIPRAYWRARLKMAKAMGLNTITTYVFWNEHEPSPGHYDFSGNNDVAEFIREAQQEGLYVVLRPGPYVCAEWEWGGYPAWLLKDHDIQVRSSDPRFMDPARRWLTRLGQELAPLQIGNGGPIILTQVENEYGSYGKDHAYMQQIRDAVVAAGFTRSQLYTADGPEQVPDGSLPDLPVGINFGGGDADASQKAFATLKKERPNGPFFNSEYWAGWFDHWGGKHAHTSVEHETANLDWMLKQGYSVSVYMFHGGTSFGWMNGANFDSKGYTPDVTSYDYDSPLDESGRPTKKYRAFRDVIAKDTGLTPPPVPEVAPAVAASSVKLTLSASLWDNLPEPVTSDKPLSMEDLDQAYGYILYRTTLPKAAAGELVLDQVHSYAAVFLDGTLVGTIDRKEKQDRVTLPAVAKTARLDILVENTGRVNYGHAIGGERAGITKSVQRNGQELLGWKIFPLPLASPENFHYSATACSGPCFYKGTLSVARSADTFVDAQSAEKGELWWNGQALGRVWNIGPQRALYAPAPWVKAGSNAVILFDLFGKGVRAVQGLDHPNLGGEAQ